MCSNETSSLRYSGGRALHDERHEQQGDGEVLCIELDDKERDLARGIVLSVRPCVPERQRVKESRGAEESASETLLHASVSDTFPLPHRST